MSDGQCIGDMDTALDSDLSVSGNTGEATAASTAPGAPLPEMFLSKAQRQARQQAEREAEERRRLDHAQAILRAQLRESAEWTARFRHDLVGEAGSRLTDPDTAATTLARLSAGVATASSSGTVNLRMSGTTAPYPTPRQAHVTQRATAVAGVGARLLRLRTAVPAPTILPHCDPLGPEQRRVLMAPLHRPAPMPCGTDAAATAAAAASPQPSDCDIIVVSPEICGLSAAPEAVPQPAPISPLPEGLASSTKANALYTRHYRACATCSDEEVRASAWPEKYRPARAADVIGNRDAVLALKTWLGDWKARMELLRKRRDAKGSKQKRKRRLASAAHLQRGKGGSPRDGSREEEDTDASCMEDLEYATSDSEGGEDALVNVMLLRGACGTGKTAAVYACAAELEYNVLEINTSESRSGRRLLSMFREATESHQVCLRFSHIV